MRETSGLTFSRPLFVFFQVTPQKTPNFVSIRPSSVALWVYRVAVIGRAQTSLRRLMRKVDHKTRRLTIGVIRYGEFYAEDASCFTARSARNSFGRRDAVRDRRWRHALSGTRRTWNGYETNATYQTEAMAEWRGFLAATTNYTSEIGELRYAENDVDELVNIFRALGVKDENLIVLKSSNKDPYKTTRHGSIARNYKRFIDGLTENSIAFVF